MKEEKFNRIMNEVDWVQYNVDKIIFASNILDGVRIYKFEKEDKDKFIDAIKILDGIIHKYKKDDVNDINL